MKPIPYHSPLNTRLFAALTVQSLAAILLTFSNSLILSFALAVIILGAVAWMIHIAKSIGTRHLPPTT